MHDVRNIKRLFLGTVTFLFAVIVAVAALTSGGSAAYAGTAWDGTIAAGFSAGTGTEEDPYIVTDGAELAYLASVVNGGDDLAGKFVRQTADIDLGDEAWTPIGTSVEYVSGTDPETGEDVIDLSVKNFNGTFYADPDKKITNLSVSGVYSAGLFGYVGETGTVRSVSVVGATLAANDFLGAVCGSNDGVISECSASDVTGAVEPGQSGISAGGLVGVSYGTVSSCLSFNASISGFVTVGGVVGSDVNKEIFDGEGELVGTTPTYLRDCAINGATLSATDLVGGVVGLCEGTAERLFSTSGTLSLVGTNVGGILGAQSGTLSYAKLSSELSVTADELFGGIVGTLTGDASDCVFAPEAFSLTYGESTLAGGIVGTVGEDGTLSHSYAMDLLLNNSAITGGAVGQNAGAISECFVVGRVSGAIVGGLVGDNGGTVEKVLFVGKNASSVLGVTGTDAVGGIVGHNGGSVDYALSVANLSLLDDDHRGGIAGTNGGTVSHSFYDGGAVYDDEDDFAYSLSDMTSAYLSLPDSVFVQSEGDLPVIKYFSTYSGASVVGLTDLYATDMSEATNVDLSVTATLDGDPYSTKTGLYLQLPAVSMPGYDFSGWESSGEIYPIYTLVEDGDYVAKLTLKEIVLGAQSDDIDKTFDETEETIAVAFSHYFAPTYQWYYSSDGSSYEAIVGADQATYGVEFVAQSGYYYLSATVTDGLDTVVKDNSSTPILVSIGNATYSSAAHPAIDGGTYRADGRLSDFALNAGFFWADGDVRPTCGQTSYPAIYNADPNNYDNFSLAISLTLDKAEYANVTHPRLDLGRYTGATLEEYGGLNEGYVWIDGTVVPNVAWSAGVIVERNYAARYNADPVNYNDYNLNVSVYLDRAQYGNVEYDVLYGVYDPAKTLADYTLVSADYAWIDDTIVPRCGNNGAGYGAVYCADPINFEPYRFLIDIELDRAPTTVTVPVEEGPYYEGDELPDISISTSSVPGNVAWTETILRLGEYDYVYTFTPNDAENYATYENTKTLNAIAPAVVSIELSGLYKTEYFAFETFEPYGLIVTATYVNGKQSEVSGYEYEYANGEESFLCVGETAEVGGVTVYVNVVTVRYDGFEQDLSLYVHRIGVETPADESLYRYDGEEKTLGVGNNEAYLVTGEVVGTEVGDYTATATLIDGTNYYFGEESDPKTSCQIEWSILKGQVSVPQTADSLVYNGHDLSCGIPSSAFYDISGTATAVDAGAYRVLLRLRNEQNYEWANGTTAEIALDWSIAEKPVSYPVPEEREYLYDGTEKTFAYSLSEETAVEVTGDRRTAAGTSDVVFTLVSENYVWTLGGKDAYTLSWTIERAKFDYPVAVDKTYVYSEQTQYFEYVAGDYCYTSGRSATDAGSYDVAFRLSDPNYAWQDGSTDEYVLEFVILPKETALPVSKVASFVYDGTTKFFSYDVSFAEVSVTGDRGIEAKEYEAVFSLKSENFCWSDGSHADRTLYWTIEPGTIGVPTAAVTNFLYDGTPKSLLIAGSDAYEVEGARETNAGEYAASVNLVDDNYIWSDGTRSVKYIEWSISPVRVEKPVFVGKYPVYTGSVITAEITRDPAYVITGDKQTTVNHYTASVNLSDRRNYVWTDGTTGTVEIDWEIVTRVLTLEVGATSYPYTGETVRLLASAGPIAVTSGTTAIDAGSYRATFDLPDKSNNVWSDGTTAQKVVEWSVTPARVEKPSVVGDSVYSAFGATARIPAGERYVVSDDFATDVGEYTATVSLRDKKNTVWSDGTIADLKPVWHILPARVDRPVKVSDLAYTGGQQRVEIIADDPVTITGDVGLNVGQYVAIAALSDKKNFCWTDGTTTDVEIRWAIYGVTLSVDGKEDLSSYILGAPLPTPTKEGYVFGGWYTDASFAGSPVTALSEITDDTVLYAKWTEETTPVDQGEGVVGKSGGGLSTSAIIGIVIAGIGALIAVGIIILALSRRPRRRDY